MLKTVGDLLGRVWNRAETTPGPRVIVHALIDATSPDLMVGSLHRIDAFASAARHSKGQLVVEADVFRAPFEVQHDKLNQHGRAIERALEQFEPWQGHRTYRIDAHGASVRTEDADTAPRASDFADNLAASMREYPHAVHVIYVYGHGSGHHRIAHMAAEDLGRAIEQRCDGPVALAVIDSCYEGNIESLAALPSNVQAVVASQIPTSDMVLYRGYRSEHDKQIDLEHILPVLARSETGDGIELGRQVLAQAATVGWPHAISLLDMRAFREQLLPALGTLGSTITGAPAGVLQQADTARRAATSVLPAAGLADLGDFLRQEAAEPGATGSAAAAAQQAVGSTVIDTVASPEQAHLSGLSFQRVARCWMDRPDMKTGFGLTGDSATYDDVRLPADWKNFIASLDPR